MKKVAACLLVYMGQFMMIVKKINFDMPLVEFSNKKIPVYTYPKPQIRKIEEDKSPSAEMRKWLLEGHKNVK